MLLVIRWISLWVTLRNYCANFSNCGISTVPGIAAHIRGLGNPLNGPTLRRKENLAGAQDVQEDGNINSWPSIPLQVVDYQPWNFDDVWIFVVQKPTDRQTSVWPAFWPFSYLSNIYILKCVNHSTLRNLIENSFEYKITFFPIVLAANQKFSTTIFWAGREEEMLLQKLLTLHKFSYYAASRPKLILWSSERKHYLHKTMVKSPNVAKKAENHKTHESQRKLINAVTSFERINIRELAEVLPTTTKDETSQIAIKWPERVVFKVLDKLLST